VVGAVVTVEAPAAVSFAGAICALAATFGGDGSRRSEDGGAVETVAASRHWLRSSRIGSGNIDGEWRLR
jgi:hypothetical protein